MTYRAEWEQHEGSRGFGGFGRGGGWSATKVLLVSMVAMFVLTLLADWGGGRNWISYLLTLRLDNAVWVFPFATYAFQHDQSSLFHLLFNCLLIWFFGSSLEHLLGRRRFLGLFFGAVVTGAVLHVATQLLFWPDQNTLLLGASGGALGLLIYLAWAQPDQRIIFLIFPMRLRTLAYLVLILDIYPILRMGNPANRPDGVAHFCHLGGALFGYLCWRFQWDPLAVFARAKERVSEQVEVRRVERRNSDDEEMDRLLGKISEHGLPSLTDAERRFMERRSKEYRDGRRR